MNNGTQSQQTAWRWKGCIHTFMVFEWIQENYIHTLLDEWWWKNEKLESTMTKVLMLNVKHV